MWRDKPWLVPVLIAVGLALLLVFSKREVRAPDGGPIVTSDQEYATTMREAERMSKELFAKAARGDELSPQEKDRMLEAAKLFEAMNRWLPVKVTTHFAAGRAYQIVGLNDLAEVRYRQAINNGQFDKSPEGQFTLPEAHFRLGELRYALGDYEGALSEHRLAVKAVPNAPEYLVGLAGTLVQLKKMKEADLALHQALQLQPNHSLGTSLHKMVKAELEQQKNHTPAKE